MHDLGLDVGLEQDDLGLGQDDLGPDLDVGPEQDDLGPVQDDPGLDLVVPGLDPAGPGLDLGLRHCLEENAELPSLAVAGVDQDLKMNNQSRLNQL